jgi:hypothetical protein
MSDHNEGSRWLIRDHGRQTGAGSGPGPECLCIGLSEAVAGFLGDATPLGDITPRLIVEHKNQLFSEELAPVSVSRHLPTLKKAFNLAICQQEW